MATKALLALQEAPPEGLAAPVHQRHRSSAQRGWINAGEQPEQPGRV